MINIDQVKQDLRPINTRMSKEQISAMEKEVNFFADKIMRAREKSDKSDLERKSQLKNMFNFWK